MKVAIIGTGRVGSTLAYALVLKQVCGHLVIAGRDPGKAWGDALDLRHTLAFCARPMRIEGAANDEVAGCDVIVITASVPMEAQLTSRLQLGEKNVELFRALIPTLAANNPDALLVVVSNPVDVMTYAASKLSGFAPGRVMGVGTLVDSARFRDLLSQELHIHPDDLRAYTLGEHGPHQFPVLGSALAGGELIGDTPAHREIFAQVVEAGFEVYRLKGYTNHAVATAASMVVEAIAYDECRTMPLVARFEEWMGVADNCFSVPVVVGRGGILRHLRPELNALERQALQATAAEVKRSICTLVPDLVGVA